MTLKIYGVLRSRASRNVWFAKELGLAYEHVPVIQSYRLPDAGAADAPLNTTSPSFLAINPNGQVPAIDDHGFVLAESLAINLYLARKHGGPLSPLDWREEALMTAWSFWATNACEPHTIQILFHRAGKPPDERDPAVADAAIAALHRPLAVLEATLRTGAAHLVGGRFTVADLNVAEVMRYAQAAPELIDAYPGVKAWLAACQSRPAYREMMAARELEPA